ncbi:hypothetical protein PTSG_07729 [Salpingoeca rosetta]|uniref:SRPBCC family protein n=1 Tax=Salpingoeca rosetta (strain ATCC 50818 / BSB-021) TaxID=946362 RepID=F2UHL6_SALR5|nr:uncharacterized protein PTSG_07729 [Salpingoeca rosetta]EGD76615.1 hypothetical protein PTSG_07729 [Salpingoeca rosetta]|eukprot:XP_004991529.1 hypothetical protein PTSG_07729 [Salpingoeca rosetta]
MGDTTNRGQDEAAETAAAAEAVADCMLDVSVDVPANAERAFKLWLDHVWLGGGGLGKPAILEEGDTNHHRLHCVRRVAGGVKEKITAVDPFDAISYRIIGGPFPVRSHHATVHFREKGPNVTNVHWHCEMDIPWGLQWIVTAITRFAFNRMLSALATAAATSP